MMKVVHIITGLSTGGAEMMLYKLLAGIDKNKFSCEVISLTDCGQLGRKLDALGIPVHKLEIPRGKFRPLALIRLISLIRRIRPDLVQTWLYHSDLLGGIAAKMAGCKKIYWNIRQTSLAAEHNKTSTLRTAKACAVLSSRIPQKIICCSEAAKISHIAFGYSEGKIQVIPNGFDLDVFKPDPGCRKHVMDELGIGYDSYIVGIVARFDPQKDHQGFVSAAGLVLKEFPLAHFLLCGEGINSENQQLNKWIADTKAGDHFHLMGPRSDTPRLFAAMDIAVSSSIGEGFSNVIGEAMACAVPCVVTDVGDSALIVGDTGKIVPPGNPESLAHAVIEVFSMPPEDRQQAGIDARNRIKNLFSIDAIVKQYEQAYHDQ